MQIYIYAFVTGIEEYFATIDLQIYVYAYLGMQIKHVLRISIDKSMLSWNWWNNHVKIKLIIVLIR